MEQLTRHLFPSNDTVEDATYRFLSLLNIRVNRSTLSDRLREHPDYPSLLSVKDVIDSFGLETLALRPDPEQWPDVPVPFMTQIATKGRSERSFTVVRPATDDRWEYLVPGSGKWLSVAKAEFDGQFMPVSLFAEAGESSGEPDYLQTRKRERTASLGSWARALALPVTAILILLTGFLLVPALSVAQSLFFFLMLIGASVGGLLLLYEIDKHNPIIKQVCSGGNAKAGCHAVLDSVGGKFLGVSWSLVGFTYFLGGTLLMLPATPGHLAFLPALSLLSLAALPYVGYSLFYQWRVVKQWCRLCLATQAVLLAQAGLVLYEGWWRTAIGSMTVTQLFSMLFVYLLVFIFGEALAATGKRAKEGEESKLSFKRMKSNTRIFESLLARERALESPADGMGVILGNPDAPNTLVKVCNPYCGPCAKAHPDIENLLRQNRDLRVQIIFTATGEDGDNRTPPVRHLLAIASRGDQATTRQALDDWYLAEKKDYDVFAAKYPMNGELERQGDHIERMHQWCQANTIRHTPTYFINGRELPDVYKLADLDYFLKS